MAVAVAVYQAYKIGHVVAAVAWLGGGLTLSLLGARLAKLGGDPRRLAAFAKDAEWIGNHVFMPAGLLVLLFGFLMIHEGPWTFHQLWIQLALGLFAVTFITGAAFLGPQAGKIGTLIDELGVEAPAVSAQIRRVLFISRLDLLTLYSIVVVMVAKPVAGDTLLFTVWAVVLALAAAGVVWDYRRDAAKAPAAVPAAAE